MTSPFDPTVYSQMTFSQKASTESFPVPVGEHVCTIKEAKLSAWEKKDKSAGGLKVTFALECEDADGSIKEVTGRDKASLRYEFILDMTEDGNGLDFGKGKNIRLGRIQEAVGIADGQPWSFDSFAGRRLIAKVKHEPYNEQLMAAVESVRAA